ncbi:hypothetical protein UFOVP33_76 [uncultured Caudovirales phage]|uniref:Uncharacterized protein n=1 Tax=uncultured Caudovirales phage TaxID=2100421 RepID=A0A6J5KNX4_9CAUD|nr:hypothetical protein UFOVP33_76 [uncultured Caudovirales phage]
MSTITTRAGKGAPLTNAELDANFTALNADKLEASALAPYLTIAAAAAAYLALSGGTLTGDLSFSGNGRRILGDFSNATYNNRLMFVTSTANSATNVAAIPSGTGTQSALEVYGANDTTNAAFGRLLINSTQVSIRSAINGTGAYLPFTLWTGGSERFRVGETSGNFLLGTTTDDGTNKLQVAGGAALTGNLTFSGTGQRILGDFTSNTTVANRLMFQSSTVNGNTLMSAIPNGTATTARWMVFNASDPANSAQGSLSALSTDIRLQSFNTGTGTLLPLTVYVGSGEVSRWATSGNLLLGTTTDDGTNKLQVNGGVSATSFSGSGANLTNVTPANGTVTPAKLSTGAPTWDANGNTGFGGVTISGWGAGNKAVEFGVQGNALFALAANQQYLISNAYYNGSAFKYSATGYATAYQQYQGTHAWLTAASGSAGATVSFTQSVAFGKGTSLALEGASSVAGTGISFPATQSASSDANTLDDYEEGTFSPYFDSFTAGTGRVTTVYTAKYVKVGKAVSVTMYLGLSTIGTGGSSYFAINGLPFTADTNSNYYAGFAIGYYSSMGASAMALGGYLNPNSTQILITAKQATSDNLIAINWSPWAAQGMQMMISFTYIASA